MIFLFSCVSQNYDYTLIHPQKKGHRRMFHSTWIEDWDLLDSFMLGVKTFSLSPSYEELYAYPDQKLYRSTPLESCLPFHTTSKEKFSIPNSFGRDVMF